MIGLPKIDDLWDKMLADDDVDGFQVQMHDLVVDEIAHTKNNVEEDVDLGAEGKCFIAELHEVIKLLAV